MLRRRPDDTFEFRQVESALWSARPASLSPERKEALRLRIMSQLNAQEQVRPAPMFLRERWVAIPAGVGIAAAIIAAVQVERATAPDTGHRMVVAHATGDLLVDGRVSDEALPGQIIEARSYSWLSLGDDVRIGLEPGSSTSYQDDLGRISVRLLHGHLTVANAEYAALIVGDNWTASLAPGTAAMFRMVDGMVVVTVADGEVTIVAGDRTIHVTAGNGPALITEAPMLAPETPRILPPAVATPAAAQGQQTATSKPQQADITGAPAAPHDVPAALPPLENSGFNPPPATKAPDHHDNAGGVAVPPGQAKAEGEPASPTPPAATPADPTHPATPHSAATPSPAATPTPPANPGNSPEWSNAGGNGNGNAGGNENGNAGGNAASNPGGANPNAGGGNPNAGGGNPNAGGGNPNAGGGNPNAGGANPNPGGANPNAGGGNPNAGGANPNAGGGNPNASGGNPNAGGGNPNAGGGNPNAGGGNPNASGGNPNASGGNPNAGGGNPNANGGNPNAGGNGNGKGNGKR